MTTVTLLTAGDADNDVLANLNTPVGQQLKAALTSNSSLANDIAFASRPQTNDYNTDCFKIPANAYSFPWPSWKETPLPLPTNQVNTNFGTWNSQGTLFTFSKGGLFQVNGSFGLGFVPAGNYATEIRIVIKIILAYGAPGQETKIEATTWQDNQYVANFQSITGGQGSFSKVIRVSAGHTVGLIASRTRKISYNGSDEGVTGLATGTAISNWMDITQLRGE